MPDLASDVLRGAAAIAEELFDNRSQKFRRKVYHLHSRRALPTWIEGNRVVSTSVCASAALRDETGSGDDDRHCSPDKHLRIQKAETRGESRGSIRNADADEGQV